MLIGAPYKMPAVAKGELTICLYRDAEVIITSFSRVKEESKVKELLGIIAPCPLEWKNTDESDD